MDLRKIIDRLKKGFAGKSFENIVAYLLTSGGVADQYMCLADFDSYMLTHERALKAYKDRQVWNRMSLMNIAGSPAFFVDRTVQEYCDKIWDM